jgi:trehalose-phosphatase
MSGINRPSDFPGWSAVFPEGAPCPGVLLLLDFDGTLSEIVPSPETAVLRPGNARSLQMLSRKPGSTVGIISGRALDDVANRVGLPELVYAGNHGMEIQGPGFQYLHPDVLGIVPHLSETASLLRLGLSEIPGAQLEDKTITLTVHYRQVPAQYHEQVQSMVNAVTYPEVADRRYRLTHAKSAIEVRPAVDWHKGRALEFIRSRLAPGAYPIYIGDDRTDEDAFRAAQAAGGCGVFVGPAGAVTDARYRLESPAAVSAALADLALL